MNDKILQSNHELAIKNGTHSSILVMFITLINQPKLL